MSSIKKFEENGAVLIKKSIPREIVIETQELILNSLKDQIKKNNKRTSVKKSLDSYLDYTLRNNNLIEIQREIVNYLLYKNQIKKILLSKKLINILKLLLGPDIHYLKSFDIAINRTNQKGYFFKERHQEYWSGCGLSTIQLWIPIFYEKNMGTIDYYPKSHKLGLIPNINRKPIELPEGIKSKNLKIDLGDVFIFHSLTLHNSCNNNSKKTRLALPIQLKNIYYQEQGYDDLKEFGELLRGPLAKIKKILGNPQLSPFRTENRKIIKI